MNKKIIINADDFGLTRAVNYAIVDSFINKSICSTSLMVNTSATLHAIELMKLHGISDVGIHVNVTIGKPLLQFRDISTLVDENGAFHHSEWWKSHTVDEEELIHEFQKQIETFIELTAMKPNHINFHHTFDFYKKYPKLRRFLLQYQLPMRLESIYEDYEYHHVQSLRTILDNSEYHFLDDVHAQYVEFPCHIGYIDNDLINISSFVNQRVEDFRIVNDDKFKSYYEGLGYRLSSWSDIEKIK